ncbi:hypothetical protein TRVL_09043 [Trypanosoma vivax]|uniref:Uncharacterized protein n=1 Tax=Trypanosoma vivax (strain Y486) TaxID=1055687 RepID=G0TYP0_TRYVY|nr:hypothetical protein TRVL_09043 [Trypanosoma vivax]CCC49089.1 hypothetical protein, unlikely [Trypanosoma vivax Y486]
MLFALVTIHMRCSATPLRIGRIQVEGDGVIVQGNGRFVVTTRARNREHRCLLPIRTDTLLEGKLDVWEEMEKSITTTTKKGVGWGNPRKHQRTNKCSTRRHWAHPLDESVTMHRQFAPPKSIVQITVSRWSPIHRLLMRWEW